MCPPGSYCPPGSKIPFECPAGSYQDEDGKTHCKDCPVGYFCYGNSTTYIGNDCPKGHYCPVNTTTPEQYKCPPGTFNNQTTQTDNRACVPCTAGMFCLGYGNPAPTGICQERYYCPEGSNNSTAIICPVGSFCPDASKIPILCTGGSYCDQTGLAKPTFECREGFYCTLEASVSNPTDNRTGNVCPKGYYCPRGSSVPMSCPIGTFLNSTENMYVIVIHLFQ